MAMLVFEFLLVKNLQVVEQVTITLVGLSRQFIVAFQQEMASLVATQLRHWIYIGI